MAGLYSHTTRATGTVLTATIYNNDHQNHIDNHIPTMMDDYSANVAQMQSKTDPGEVGSESLATSLAGELERLRQLVAEATGKTQWYETPPTSLAAIEGSFTDIASATTTDLSTVTNRNVRITGTTTITGLGTADAGTTKRVRFAAALILTHNGTSLILPGTANITTAANDTLTVVSLGSGNWIVTSYQRATGIAVVGSVTPRGYIDGLIMSNNSGDSAHDVDFTAGLCRDVDDSDTIEVAAITKQFDAAWAVGTDAGVLDGTETVPGTMDASTWYAVWAIMRTDTRVTDILGSESFSAPTLPTDYDKKRYIGAVFSDASNNVTAFVQDGDHFQYDTPPSAKSVTADHSASRATLAIDVPVGVKVLAQVNVGLDDIGNNSAALLTDLATADVAVNASPAINSPIASVHHGQTNSGSMEDGIASSVLVRTDTSAQIGVRSNTAGADTYIVTVGWYDQRGKNAA